MSTEITSNEVSARIKQIVWRYAGVKSTREIAELTGLPPERVLALKKEMYDTVDALTIDQQLTRCMVQLQEISERAREEFESTTDARSKAPLLSASVTAIKTLLNEMRNIRKTEDKAVSTLNAKRQSELVTLMQNTVDRSVEEIAQKYDVDKQSLFDIFNRRLLEAAEEMTARNTE